MKTLAEDQCNNTTGAHITLKKMKQKIISKTDKKKYKNSEEVKKILPGEVHSLVFPDWSDVKINVTYTDV